MIQSQLAQDHCPAPIRVFEAGVLFFVWCLVLRPLGAFETHQRYLMGSQGFYTLQGMSDLKVYRQFSPLEFKDRTEERYTSEGSTKGILKECGLKEKKTVGCIIRK